MDISREIPAGGLSEGVSEVGGCLAEAMGGLSERISGGGLSDAPHEDEPGARSFAEIQRQQQLEAPPPRAPREDFSGASFEEGFFPRASFEGGFFEPPHEPPPAPQPRVLQRPADAPTYTAPKPVEKDEVFDFSTQTTHFSYMLHTPFPHISEF